jgi:hypothetical protein
LYCAIDTSLSISLGTSLSTSLSSNSLNSITLDSHLIPALDSHFIPALHLLRFFLRLLRRIPLLLLLLPGNVNMVGTEAVLEREEPLQNHSGLFVLDMGHRYDVSKGVV